MSPDVINLNINDAKYYKRRKISILYHHPKCKDCKCRLKFHQLRTTHARDDIVRCTVTRQVLNLAPLMQLITQC